MKQDFFLLQSSKRKVRIPSNKKISRNRRTESFDRPIWRNRKIQLKFTGPLEFEEKNWNDDLRVVFLFLLVLWSGSQRLLSLYREPDYHSLTKAIDIYVVGSYEDRGILMHCETCFANERQSKDRCEWRVSKKQKNKKNETLSNIRLPNDPSMSSYFLLNSIFTTKRFFSIEIDSVSEDSSTRFPVVFVFLARFWGLSEVAALFRTKSFSSTTFFVCWKIRRQFSKSCLTPFSYTHNRRQQYTSCIPGARKLIFDQTSIALS